MGVSLMSNPVPAASSGLVSLRQSVSTLLARSGRRSLDEMNNSSIKLILGQLLVIVQNSATENQSLSIRSNSYSVTDMFLEVLDCFLLVNIIKLMILRI